jgi:hypothetical protein
VILACGVLAAVQGDLRPGRHRRLWRATASILTLFLIDELSPLHAQIGDFSFGVGKLLYAPILLGLVLCVWMLAARTTECYVVAAGLVTLSTSFGHGAIATDAFSSRSVSTWNLSSAPRRSSCM